MIRKPAAGLTLIELMITIAIMAIVLTLAAPSFRTLLLNNRLKGQVDGVFNGLNYARSTALSTNTPLTFCPIAANGVCAGTNWAAGWMVVDPNIVPPTILLSSAASPTGPVLYATAPGGGAGVALVTFNPRGLAGGSAYFEVCDSRGPASAGSVMVMPTGFVQSGSSSTPGTAAWGDALGCP